MGIDQVSRPEVGGRAARSDLEDGSAVIRSLIAERLGEDAPEWELRLDATWLRCLPSGAPDRDQGWKLHVSATVSSAEEILRRVTPILAAERCPFKVAATFDVLAALNDARAPRASSGKFLTVYPRDDAQLRRIAAKLHAGTEGCAGPRILSDRQYRPASLVHLRYGAFRGYPLIDHDGGFHNALRDPQGNLVEDRRKPTFTPPSWATLPLPRLEKENEPAKTAQAVLLADRFLVRQAVRHANKGGVFRALDTATGAEVLVKQARAHVGGSRSGPDVQALLGNEAAALSYLEPLRRTPRFVLSFEQEQDLFLVEELLPATSLRQWMTRSSDGDVSQIPAVELSRLAVQIAELVSQVHARGVVIRDLTPNNLLVDEQLDVWLVDLEMTVHPSTPVGDVALGAGTAGYAAPEQLAGERPALAADLWSLGAVLCFLFTGQDPYVHPASVTASSPERRLDSWLRARHRRAFVPDDVLGLIRRLTTDDPAARPDASTVARSLRRAQRSAPRPSSDELSALSLTGLASPSRGTQLVSDLIDGIVAAAGRHAGPRRWPSSSFGETTDPRCVQHGAAGVLGVLVQAFHALGDGRLLDDVAQAARWLAPRVQQPIAGPVGLYFGASGPAWALAAAADALEDEALRRVAVDSAMRQPVDWPNPDVTHGRAGLGLTLLQLWRRTGDDRLLAQAGRVADTLVRDAEIERDGSTTWRTPDGVASTFAGKRFHGFAHGTAGVAMFLLELGRATGRDECLGIAQGAADTLLAAAVTRDGTTSWGSSPEEPGPGLPYWCNGSAGVGTFLLRAYQDFGDDRLLPVLDGAARSIMAAKWSSGISYCHGLAGNADFLLHAADVLAEPAYRVWAEDLAALLESRAVWDGGRLALTDVPGRIAADFAVGTAGCLSFLLRLQHGGPRLWLPETRSQA
jgi:hypothetical protein